MRKVDETEKGVGKKEDFFLNGCINADFFLNE
jgi:hypothetical protein